MRFSDLELEDKLKEGIEALGFETLTPVQEGILGEGAEEDLLVQAQTGTGKTAAFIIRALNMVEKESDKKALVVLPTRELAQQVFDEAGAFGAHCSARLALLVGGTPYEKQREQIRRGANLVVATPGRLIDFLKQKEDLGVFNLVILDEADRLFDMGFMDDIRFILQQVSCDDTHLYLLSATVSSSLGVFSQEFMPEAREIAIETDKLTVENVTQGVYHVEGKMKFSLLSHLLKEREGQRVVIFANTKSEVFALFSAFERLGRAEEIGFLTGDVDQKKRFSTMKKFKEERIRTLICTDVAARGLNMNGVALVVNFDLPENPESYVHRIGRTARAGAKGEAYSFSSERDVYNLAPIEKLVAMALPVLPVPEDIEDLGTERLPRGDRDRFSGGDRPRRDRGDRRGSFPRRDGGGDRRSSGRDSHRDRPSFERRRPFNADRDPFEDDSRRESRDGGRSPRRFGGSPEENRRWEARSTTGRDDHRDGDRGDRPERRFGGGSRFSDGQRSEGRPFRGRDDRRDGDRGDRPARRFGGGSRFSDGQRSEGRPFRGRDDRRDGDRGDRPARRFGGGSRFSDGQRSEGRPFRGRDDRRDGDRGDRPARRFSDGQRSEGRPFRGRDDRRDGGRGDRPARFSDDRRPSRGRDDRSSRRGSEGSREERPFRSGQPRGERSFQRDSEKRSSRPRGERPASSSGRSGRPSSQKGSHSMKNGKDKKSGFFTMFKKNT